MDMKKLLTIFESKDNNMAKAEHNPEGPKFKGYWKGTDKGTPKPGQGVGGCEESILKDLSKGKSKEQELAEQYQAFLEAEINEDPFKDIGEKRPARKGSREEKYGKRGHKEQPRYKEIKEAAGDGEVANAVIAEVIKLIGEGHTEVSPDVITTKVSAALYRPTFPKC